MRYNLRDGDGQIEGGARNITGTSYNPSARPHSISKSCLPSQDRRM